MLAVKFYYSILYVTDICFDIFIDWERNKQKFQKWLLEYYMFYAE